MTRENGLLRQEIAFLRRTMEAMRDFHHHIQTAFDIMQTSFQDLGRQTAKYEGDLLQVYGVDLTDVKPEDVFVL